MSDTAAAIPDLGKKVGPLPVGGWMAVIGGGIGIVYYVRNKRATTNAVPVDSAGSPLATGAGGALDQTGGVGSGPGGWSYQPPSAQTAATITTNDEWYRAGMEDLLAKNYDANLADTSLRRYLAAQSLTPQQLTLIAIVLKDIGPLPSPLPPSDQTIPTQNPTGTGTNPDTTVPDRPVGATGLPIGGFTGQVGDHVSSGTKWGSPTPPTTHYSGSWGTTR